ncbi:carbamoyltransferase C-terminal domain-containing protein [Pseudomonas aeruginosa]|uniref:carbamoyltransferase C-terminal domain-containing protein n=1 Tax=Pseudomonas aeruginosa TaxID=287 RepID=UPI0038C69F48|nr:proline dehydrogenase [Pseudomonas aeruginosa]
MRILGINLGHDGHICLLKDGQLSFSRESEKDSGKRYANLSPSFVLKNFLSALDGLDAIAISGWAEGNDPRSHPVDGGYLGFNVTTERIDVGDRELYWLTCSHEYSHIASTYALSPFSDVESCYVLLWEGFIGRFYLIEPDMKVNFLGEVMESPGLRYGFAYGLADPTFNLPRGYSRLGDAGKMMALAAYGEAGPLSEAEAEVVDYIMNCESALDILYKPDLRDSAFHNIGVQSKAFCNLSRKLTDLIFDKFFRFAQGKVDRALPLLISGGCGLNCEWNKKWSKSGLFSSVFVSPCTNDSGVGIGAAAIAQKLLTEKLSLDWSVYSGDSFIEDIEWTPEEADVSPLDYRQVSEALLRGEIVCWVQGNCEIGPRALGNRSILAAPFSEVMTKKINSIKQREPFRPIAPVCLQEDASLHFDRCTESKYMLDFYNVLDCRLRAITHVDGTARVQTVTSGDNPPLYELLKEFKRISGVGVLCNTSLNFKGKGFINRMSQLKEFSTFTGISILVVNDKMYKRTPV